MKKILSALLVCVMLVSAICMCSCDKPETPAVHTDFGFEGTKELAASGTKNSSAADVTVTGDVSKVKIGLIMVGDETEGYTKAHMDGIKGAAAALGIQDSQLVWKYKVEETEAVVEAGKQLITEGCNYIFSNSYGHQDFMYKLATEYPDVHFVAMTGDTAAAKNLPNFSNAFTGVYQSRYVSGVVAGLKLKELIDAGKVQDKNKDGDDIRIGYVGAFNYAEVVSGYTAFYLGLKSIVSNIKMDVYYTSSWFNFDAEKAAAELLIDKGCIIIGQHADSAGAPTAVQEAFNKGTTVFSVGYNVSMLDACPDAALTSASNSWQVYYQYAFSEAINGANVATNWSAGYDKGAVTITELGKACAAGTKEKVAEVEQKIMKGEIKVFDTSKFTVEGKQVTWAYASDTDGDWANDSNNVIANGQYYESYVQSAPSFSLRIDGITELN